MHLRLDPFVTVNRNQTLPQIRPAFRGVPQTEAGGSIGWLVNARKEGRKIYEIRRYSRNHDSMYESRSKQRENELLNEIESEDNQ